MEIILGLLIIYVWTHSGIIIGRKMKFALRKEKTIVIIGVVMFALAILGAMAK